VDIALDDPARADVRALLEEHLRHMRELSPPESVHALDVEALRTPDVSFYTARVEGVLYGCGALKQLHPEHGELKSMRTPAALRRRGAGRAILAHLLATARARGYRRVSLETGMAPAFTPARTLYLAAGFVPCGPFGSYLPDPHSAYFTLAL
jgi:putative acetyltransferase